MGYSFMILRVKCIFFRLPISSMVKLFSCLFSTFDVCTLYHFQKHCLIKK